MTSTQRLSLLYLAVGVLVIGFNLRLAVVAIGTVLTEVRDDTGLSATGAGVLTAIPVFAFGLLAFTTPFFAAKLGLHRLLGATMVALAAGTALRSAGSLWALFTGTVILGGAIAIANVVVPALIKEHFPHRVGLMMGLHTTMFNVSAAAAAALTVPLATATGGWRWALGSWAVLAVVAFALWLPASRLPDPETHPDAAHEGLFPARVWRSPVAWAVTGYLAMQAMSYYAVIAWMPTLLRDHGMSAETAGNWVAFSALPAVLSAVTAPSLAQRSRRPGLMLIVAGACYIGCFLGLVWGATSVPLLLMTLLGLAQGASISLAMSFIAWRSPDAHTTNLLSTMAQGIGYTVAGFGSIVLGALHSSSGSWTVPLVFLAVWTLVQTAFALAAGRPRQIAPVGASTGSEA